MASWNGLMTLWSVFWLVFLLFLGKFLCSAQHVLLLLLSLESFTLFGFMCITSLTPNLPFSANLLFVFLTFAVTEASMGLCLLIRTARSFGSDLLVL